MVNIANNSLYHCDNMCPCRLTVDTFWQGISNYLRSSIWQYYVEITDVTKLISSLLITQLCDVLVNFIVSCRLIAGWPEFDTGPARPWNKWLLLHTLFDLAHKLKWTCTSH